MRSPTLLVVSIALFAASCGGVEGSGGQHATMGSLVFEVPHEWKRTDTTDSGSMTSVWAPDASANQRKESITVIHSQIPATPRGKPAPAMIGRLLAGAQGTLRGARVSPVTSLTTARGLSAASIDVTFQPGTGSQRYRRTHVILLDADADADADAFVHVLYTAATPDESSEALQLVLDSIHREEG